MPGRPDFTSAANYNPLTMPLTAEGQAQREQDLTAFNKLTPESMASSEKPPTWNDVFNAFNAQHTAVYGKEINRAWNTDQDAQNSKLAIDNIYTQGLDAWNQAHGQNVAVDKKVLGVDAQPNSYTPDKEYHGLLNQIWEGAKPLLPIALAVVGGEFLPGVLDSIGATTAGTIAGTAGAGSGAGALLTAEQIAAMGGADIAGLSGTAAANLGASVASGMPALEAAAAAGAGAGTLTGPGLNFNSPSTLTGPGFQANPLDAVKQLSSMGGTPGLTVPTGSVLGDAASFINAPEILAAAAPGIVSAAGTTLANTPIPIGDPRSFINSATGLTGTGLPTSLPSVNTGGTTNSNTYISGGTTGGSSSGPWNSYLTPQVSRIGAIQPPTMANPLAGLVSPINTSYTPSTSMLSHLNRNNFAKGGEVVKADLDKFEPEFVDIIKKRTGGAPDHHHPNYNGTPLFRTGGAGKHVQGPGTGQSDDIPAMLADGEYVFDADTVSALGDGSNKAGASALDQMRKAIRKHKRGAPIDKIPPKAKNPLEYLRGK